MSVPVEIFRISAICPRKSEEIGQIFDAALTKFVTKKLRKFVFSDQIRQTHLFLRSVPKTRSH